MKFITITPEDAKNAKRYSSNYYCLAATAARREFPDSYIHALTYGIEMRDPVNCKLEFHYFSPESKTAIRDAYKNGMEEPPVVKAPFSIVLYSREELRKVFPFYCPV